MLQSLCQLNLIPYESMQQALDALFSLMLQIMKDPEAMEENLRNPYDQQASMVIRKELFLLLLNDSDTVTITNTPQQ